MAVLVSLAWPLGTNTDQYLKNLNSTISIQSTRRFHNNSKYKVTILYNEGFNSHH